jgi:hypothetical protein
MQSYTNKILKCSLELNLIYSPFKKMHSFHTEILYLYFGKLYNLNFLTIMLNSPKEDNLERQLVAFSLVNLLFILPSVHFFAFWGFGGAVVQIRQLGLDFHL